MSIQKKIYEDRVKNNLPERKMTPAEIKRRKKIGDKMPDETFKKRYSSPNPPADSWSDVKWATATKAAMAGESVVYEGKTEARELEIFIDNDQQLYRQQHLSIIKNLMTKRAQGKYDSKLAAKLYMYLVDNGAKKYVKEFGSKGDNWNKMFDKPTRMNVATALVKSFESEAESGGYDEFIPKKYQKKEAYESDEKNFKPHMMYDPKTGKGYKADTYQDHLRMDKMGYTHEKPELDEATNTRVVVDVNRAGYRKLESQIAGLDGYRESEFDSKKEKATFHFDAKKHDKSERGKVAGFIKKMKGAEFHHSMTEAESVPLVRTGQGSFTKDTHPKRKDGKVERMYQAKDKAEYAKLIAGADTGRRGNAYSVQGSQNKMTVTVVFDNDKQRKAFEKKMGIKEGLYGSYKKESVDFIDTLKNIVEEKRLDESNFDPKDNVFVFPSDREAKQFEKDIANAAVATGSRVGNKVEVKISALDRKTHKSVSVYMKKNKGKLQK